MDMEAIWQTHKQFIIKVGAGALLFLILSSYQGSVLREANALHGKAGSAESDLLALIEELQGAEGREKGRAENLDERLQPAVLEAMLWRADEELALPAGEGSPLLFYTQAVQIGLRRVKQAAANWNADVPRDTKGLGLAAEVDEAEVVEGLAQIDVVVRLVQRLLDAGVRSISDINVRDPGYSPLQGVGGHLRTLPVEVSFQGNTRVLARVLAELQVSGSFLEVLGCQVEREAKQPGSPLRITLDVQAISHVDAMPAGAKTSEAGQTPRGRRGGRRFGFQRER
jgi:hypothetical protein